ncbi:hypothetical protein LXL04_009272 [Taraxacum kok-saghyz]
MKPKEQEWVEVRRRKAGRTGKIGENRDMEGLSSFYVTNLPSRIRKTDVWKACAKLGDLADVYIAGRRDSGGSFFAFIKFRNVQDVADMEDALNKVILWGKNIKANISKHPRKPPLANCRAAPPRTNNPAPAPQFEYRPRDARSFADVMKGTEGTRSEQKVPPKPLKLSKCEKIREWFGKEVIIGTVRNFDMLCNFPSVISMEGFFIEEIKYMGGMKVLLKFTSNKAADVFRANKNLWLKWFSEVEAAGKSPPRFERIAWLKITGVPIEAWKEENFDTIANNFGKVLIQAQSFWQNLDVSHGKVCILTATRRKVNEELSIEVDGVSHLVGVTEMDEEWFPFKPFSPEIQTESEEEDEEDIGEDELSVNMELEDGEIPANPAMEVEQSMVDETTMSKGEEQVHGNNNSHGNTFNADQQRECHIPDGINHVNLNPVGHSPSPIQNVSTHGPIMFGPGSDSKASSPEFDEESYIKRRRTKKPPLKGFPLLLSHRFLLIFQRPRYQHIASPHLQLTLTGNCVHDGRIFVCRFNEMLSKEIYKALITFK